MVNLELAAGCVMKLYTTSETRGSTHLRMYYRGRRDAAVGVCCCHRTELAQEIRRQRKEARENRA